MIILLLRMAAMTGLGYAIARIGAVSNSTALCILYVWTIMVPFLIIREQIIHWRLAHTLGPVNDIFANAAQLRFLPFIMRTRKALKQWWIWQLGYETSTAFVLIFSLGWLMGIHIESFWLTCLAAVTARFVLTFPTIDILRRVMLNSGEGTVTR